MPRPHGVAQDAHGGFQDFRAQQTQHGGFQEHQGQLYSEYGAGRSLQKDTNDLISNKTEGSNLVKFEGLFLTMLIGQRV